MTGRSLSPRIRLRRITWLPLCALCTLLLFLTAGCKSEKAVAVGLSAPDLKIRDAVSGSEVPPESLKGKVVFINFWASWCPPCREEMPSIEALYRELSAHDDFRMITVLYKDGYAAGSALVRREGFSFPVYEDMEGRSARSYGVTGVPETYIVDRRGILKRRVLGPADWHSPEVKDFILALMRE